MRIVITTSAPLPGFTIILPYLFESNTTVLFDAGKVLLAGPAEVFYKSDIELVRRFVDKGTKQQ